MAIPLWYAWTKTQGNKNPVVPSAVSIMTLLLGFLFLFLGTTKGHSLMGANFPDALTGLLKFVGFAFFTTSFARVIFSAGSWFDIPGQAVLALGLVSFTGSPGRFFRRTIGLVSLPSARPCQKRSSRSNRPSKKNTNFQNIIIFSLGPSHSLVGKALSSRFYQSLTHLGDSLAVSRLQIWRPALKMAEAHPFFGVGLDTFKPAFPFYSGIEFNHIDGMFVSSRTAHNEFLQIAATTGWIGFSAYLFLWGLFLFLGIKAWRIGTGAQRVALAGIWAARQPTTFKTFSVSMSRLWGWWFFSFWPGWKAFLQNPSCRKPNRYATCA